MVHVVKASLCIYLERRFASWISSACAVWWNCGHGGVLRHVLDAVHSSSFLLCWCSKKVHCSVTLKERWCGFVRIRLHSLILIYTFCLNQRTTKCYVFHAYCIIPWSIIIICIGQFAIIWSPCKGFADLSDRMARRWSCLDHVPDVRHILESCCSLRRLPSCVLPCWCVFWWLVVVQAAGCDLRGHQL